MVHKGRRWRLNIKVKERPFAEGSSDAQIKMTGQTDNEYLDISFIYHWYSFLF
jgi:hypothetical protein